MKSLPAMASRYSTVPRLAQRHACCVLLGMYTPTPYPAAPALHVGHGSGSRGTSVAVRSKTERRLSSRTKDLRSNAPMAQGNQETGILRAFQTYSKAGAH